MFLTALGTKIFAPILALWCGFYFNRMLLCKNTAEEWFHKLSHFRLEILPFLGLLFPSLAVEFQDDCCELPAARVAVIGASVGGCFAAKFLRELGGQNLEIHVWNRKGSGVAGHMATTEFAGHTFETGASIMHSSNKYLVDAAKKFCK